MFVLAVSLRRVLILFIECLLLNQEQKQPFGSTNLRHGTSPRRQNEHLMEFVLENLPLL